MYMTNVLSTRPSWTLSVLRSQAMTDTTHMCHTHSCFKTNIFIPHKDSPCSLPPPQSYHICTRTLIPSISSVFILKSIPVKEEIRLGKHVTGGARKMGSICTFHPRLDKSVFGQAVSQTAHTHPLSPIIPVQSPR